MTYEIEDGIPIPASRLRGAANALRQMQVGQSVLGKKTIATTGSRISKATGHRYTQRRVDADYIRVWRTS